MTRDDNRIQELKILAQDYTILYVEDNDGLRNKACTLLEKFFSKVDSAINGQDGLDKFKELKPTIVMTDIKMPVMDGLKMARQIKKISPKTKIIITSAFDETEYLLEAINIGVFRYLKKPLGIEVITTVLLDGLKQLKLEDEDKMFDFYVKNIFNHQKNLLFLYNEQNLIIINNSALEFFGVEDLDDFTSKIDSLGDQFLEHKSFLYNHDDIEWFKEASNHSDSLHHVKMNDKQNAIHHFVLKMIPLEEEDGYYLVSLDDITELGLLKLFDEKTTLNDLKDKDKKSIISLLDTVKRNSSEIKLQNLYKGIPITNKGLINILGKDKIEIQCNFIQQKAIQHDDRLLLSSEFFPFDILCTKINKVNFEEQSVVIEDFQFVENSFSKRKNIRVEPNSEHTSSLFYQNYRFGDGVNVIDISIESLNLSMVSLPAGFKVGEAVNIDIVFTVGKVHIIINTPAKVFRITELKNRFYVVCHLEPSEKVKKTLIDYIAQRQRELIREFKGLSIGR